MPDGLNKVWTSPHAPNSKLAKCGIPPWEVESQSDEIHLWLVSYLPAKADLGL